MKKYIIISLFLASCGNGVPSKRLIVTNIDYESQSGICTYTETHSDGTKDISIEDSCGKWNIGDTIKFK